MKIESLSQLRKLLQLARQQGVNIMKIEGLGEFVLEGRPVTSEKKSRQAAETPVVEETAFTDPGKIELPPDIDTPDELTAEQLLNWSSAPSNGAQ